MDGNCSAAQAFDVSPRIDGRHFSPDHTTSGGGIGKTDSVVDDVGLPSGWFGGRVPTWVVVSAVIAVVIVICFIAYVWWIKPDSTKQDSITSTPIIRPMQSQQQAPYRPPAMTSTVPMQQPAAPPVAPPAASPAQQPLNNIHADNLKLIDSANRSVGAAQSTKQMESEGRRPPPKPVEPESLWVQQPAAAQNKQVDGDPLTKMVIDSLPST